MRLYLEAKSENNVGYTPDWIKVLYKERKAEYELTLDIQGNIDYDPTSLSCLCKGDLIPWVLFNTDTGEEEDLSELTNEELEERFPVKKLVKIFKKGIDFCVGIYPVRYDEFTDDTLKKGIGTVELYLSEEDKFYTRRFEFDTEFNV